MTEIQPASRMRDALELVLQLQQEVRRKELALPQVLASRALRSWALREEFLLAM